MAIKCFQQRLLLRLTLILTRYCKNIRQLAKTVSQAVSQSGGRSLLTGGVSSHLDDALAILGHLPGVEGADPHCHLDGSPSHGAASAKSL